MSRNLIVIIALMAVSSAYLWISPSLMPGTSSLIVVVNLVAAPFVVGLLAGYLMVGRLVLKLIALLLVPIAHIFVYGEDAAKPGLQNLVALVEVLPLWLGCVVAHMFASKKSEAEASTSGQA
jgi:hypothetical protein